MGTSVSKSPNLSLYIYIVSALGYSILGTVTKTMMAATKQPDSTSDSDDSDIPSRPFHAINLNKKFKSHKNKPNIRSKILNPNNKNTIQKSSTEKSSNKKSFPLIFSSSYLPISTHQLTDKTSPLLLITNYVLIRLISFHLETPNYLHCLLLLIYIVPYLRKILRWTTPLITPPSTMNGNQIKFILLLHYLWNLMISH